MTQVSEAAANKIFNAALFVENTQPASFINMLTDPAPMTANQKKMDGSMQTPSGAPITRLTNLEKGAGDQITMDLYHQLNDEPIMGDTWAEDKAESMTSSQFKLNIDQGRMPVRSGGSMAQQRTKHDLKKLAKQLLSPKYVRLMDQVTQIHLSGARGVDYSSRWVVPLEIKSTYSQIMVNEVTPPTFDNHFYGGDATSLSNIDASDVFTLKTVDDARLRLDEMDYPLMPITYEGDPGKGDNPFFLMAISPRQWHSFWTSTDGAEWRQLLSNAMNRGKDFKSPLFTGDCAMWHNILIKKVANPIRFTAGTTVDVCTNSDDATVAQETVGTTVDRALLLGAQALCDAWGRAGKKEAGGHHFQYTEKDVDLGNESIQSIKYMNGKAKTRFKGTDGRVKDHGVCVIDTAV